MKIVSCFVRSFGTLKDTEFDFSNGLNTFLCDNGLGKTTLISFIKAMLYGLDYKQGGAKFYERTRVLPWDGSDCGGSLTIEVSGKEYRIERSFGKKKTDDKFTLIDVDSMRESNDYDENIGEELFGVDKQSFEKSLYFGQSSLGTGITPSLNAKMGNISNVKDDMTRFDEAIKSIDNAKALYEKKSKTNPGKINVLDVEIKLCEEAINHIGVLEKAVFERKRSIDEKRIRIEDLVKTKEELSEKIKEAGKRKEKEGALFAKQEQLEKLEIERQKTLEYFGGSIPSEEEIERMQDTQRQLVEKTSRLEEIRGRLPGEERAEFLTSVFAGENRITDQIIEKSHEEAKQIAKLRLSGEKTSLSEANERELSELKEFFKEKLPTSEEIGGYLQLTERITKEDTRLQALDSSLREAENSLREAKEGAGGPYFVLGLIGVILITAGVVLGLFLPSGTISIIGLLAGLVVGTIMLVISIIFFHQERVNRKRMVKFGEERVLSLKDRIRASENEISDAKSKCSEFVGLFLPKSEEDILGKLMEIQRRLDDHGRLLKISEENKKDTAENTDALAELTMNLYTRLAGAEEKYGFNLHRDQNEEALLDMLVNDLREYDEYLKNIEAVKALEKEIEDISESLALGLEKYKVEEDKTTSQILLALKGTLESANALLKQMKTLEEEIIILSEEGKNNEETSLEELQENMVMLDASYEPLVADRAKEEEELKRLLNEIEENEERSRRLPALQEKRDELTKRVHVLVETKRYLEQARDDFLSVYMKPLRDGLDRYVGMFVPEGLSDDVEIDLDMELNVKLLRKGQTLTGDYLSEGYKDLAALCARLALIDVLYKGEKPPIFMDDPFTNLDEKKIQRALVILGQLSSKTQIVYFTCHESRAGVIYKSLYQN